MHDSRIMGHSPSHARRRSGAGSWITGDQWLRKMSWPQSSIAEILLAAAVSVRPTPDEVSWTVTSL